MNYVGYPASFTHAQTTDAAIFNALRHSKIYYAKAGLMRNMNPCFKYLQYLCLHKDIAIFVPQRDRITRSTELRYFFNDLKTWTLPNNEAQYNYTLLNGPDVIDSFELKDIFSVQLIPVLGQIEDTFNNRIPAWASEVEAEELLGVSLVLKLTPRHRVRVYKRNEHIVVFFTKTTNEYQTDDSVFIRKLWACLPLIRDWDREEYGELIEIFKALDKPDATMFWDMLQAAYDADPILKEARYAAVIQTFKTLSEGQIIRYLTQLEYNRRAIEERLAAYNDALQTMRDTQRRLAEAESNKVELDVSSIKLLIDKQIAYALDTSRISTNGNSVLSYRCAAPLLNYDKEAAKAYYRRRIKDCGETVRHDIFKLMFIDEKVVLKFDEEILIDFARGNIQARDGNLYHGNNYNEVFPNPHHAGYNCWGSYGATIAGLINSYSIEELFYQIKTAVGSLNFSDPPVMNVFIDKLDNICQGIYNPACFLWRDENCTTAHTLEETLNHFTEETDAT